MERKNIFLILGIILIAVGIFSIKKCMSGDSGCPKLDFTISSATILAGESIHFEDNTAEANEWLWDFGDGQTSDLQSGEHVYAEAKDEYIIKLTINKKCSETKTIKVSSVVISSTDTAQKDVVILGPTSAEVGDAITFGNNTDGASKWEWQFGESGANDKFTQNPTYTYNSPGKYTVVLRVDNSKKEGRLTIQIRPKPAAPKPGAPPKPKITGPALKAQFESILQGNFGIVFYDMLKEHFCNDNNVNVNINGEKNLGIYSYCMKLDIQRNTKISDVKVEYDAKTNCINKVSVTQK